jgi:hypothetical protein
VLGCFASPRPPACRDDRRCDCLLCFCRGRFGRGSGSVGWGAVVVGDGAALACPLGCFASLCLRAGRDDRHCDWLLCFCRVRFGLGGGRWGLVCRWLVGWWVGGWVGAWEYRMVCWRNPTPALVTQVTAMDCPILIASDIRSLAKGQVAVYVYRG